MKKLFKILGIIAGVVVVILIAGYIYFNAVYPNVDPPKNIKVEITPERIERGKYLANHVAACIDCHSERDLTKYAAPIKPGTEGSGGMVFQGSYGKVVSQNLTPANLGSWTDGELLRAITCGVTKDNRALFPMMPYMNYNNFSQEDVFSIISYIRTLKPQEKQNPKTELNFPLNLIVKTMPIQAYKPANEVDASDSITYGKYLVTIASCSDCHTQSNQGKPLPGMEFAGGMEFQLPSGIVRSANITPDEETGIGSWDKDNFLDRFAYFRDEDAQNVPVDMNKDFNTPMPWLMYSRMTEKDLGAIYDFLRTVKPVKNTVESFTPATEIKTSD